MANIVLVRELEDVKIEHEPGVLFTVHAKGTHNTGATNPRLAPTFSEEPKRLKLGLYVDAQATQVLTPVQASLQFDGQQFAEVCVVGQNGTICKPVFE